MKERSSSITTKSDPHEIPTSPMEGLNPTPCLKIGKAKADRLGTNQVLPEVPKFAKQAFGQTCMSGMLTP